MGSRRPTATTRGCDPEPFAGCTAVVNGAAVVFGDVDPRAEDVVSVIGAAVGWAPGWGSGAVVAVSSILELVGQAGPAPYSAAKAGWPTWSARQGWGYAPTGIRVNAVALGYVATPLTAGLDDSVRSQTTARQPIGRLGTPEEVAVFICFLASDAASFVTGAVCSVDGGHVAQ